MTVQNIVQILTAIGVIITAVVAYLNGQKTNGVKDDVAVVHEQVNSQAAAQTARVEQLAGALTTAGVQVPDRPQSDPASPPPPLGAVGEPVE